jgi:hypothetical protein
MMHVPSGVAGQRPASSLPAFLASLPAVQADGGPQREIPVLDVTRFARLRALMSPRALEQLLSSYLLDAEFQLGEILRAPDADSMAAASRILANLAAEAGAMAVAAAARRLEQACREGDAARRRRLAAALRHSCARADRMLRGFLAAQP